MCVDCGRERSVSGGDLTAQDVDKGIAQEPDQGGDGGVQTRPAQWTGRTPAQCADLRSGADMVDDLSTFPVALRNLFDGLSAEVSPAAETQAGRSLAVCSSEASPRGGNGRSSAYGGWNGELEPPRRRRVPRAWLEALLQNAPWTLPAQPSSRAKRACLDPITDAGTGPDGGDAVSGDPQARQWGVAGALADCGDSHARKVLAAYCDNLEGFIRRYRCLAR